MGKIIFIKPFNSPFVLADQKILEKNFQLKTYILNRDGRKDPYLWVLIKLSFFLLFHVSKTDAVATWFADYHAMTIVFFTRLFRKKSFIFAGGQEAVCYPELRKGVYYKKFRGKCVKYALKHASLIIPNHQSLVYHENYYYDPKGKKDGMKYYVPKLKTKIAVVNNGYDSDKYKRNYSIKKNPKMILNIGRTATIYDILNKGHDLIIQVARRNPQLEFVMMAIKKEHLDWMEDNFHISEISNLKIIPYPCTFEMLSPYFNEAKVFVQASITEGMPNTLAEAMLFECVPVGSNVNGIPDSIGDTGVIVYKRDVDELEKAIIKALSLDTGTQAREHIIKNFSSERREEELIRVLNECGIK